MTNLEERLIHLEYLDEQCQDSIVAIEENKKYVKVQYDNFFHAWRYVAGDLVLL
jgi:hypothetical protein